MEPVSLFSHDIAALLQLGAQLAEYYQLPIRVRGDRVSEWLVALRRGEFRQGKHFLRQGDDYCCMGVLCEISHVGSWRAPGDGLTVWEFVPNGASKDSYGKEPPMPVWEWLLDLSQVAPEQREHVVGVLTSLFARLNDSGMGFAGIAEVISWVLRPWPQVA
jgi:hypothetical protein